MEVRIDYAPRRYFFPLHENKSRWKVIVAHRRSGKTTACLNHLQRDALLHNDSRFAYISPTYKQSKNIAWDLLKHYAKDIPSVQFNEAELTVRYPNGSRITLYGADNPDSLRGIGLWGVVFDEYSQQPSNIFTEIIRPALADHTGYAIWIGTPKGKNEFYRLYELGQKEKEWYAELLTVENTKILPEKELEDARKVMSQDEFQQEFFCSWSASIKGAYYATELALARSQNRIGLINPDPALKVHTVWDLGKGTNMAVGFYQATFGQVRLIDYLEVSGNDGLPQVIQKVLERKYIFGKHFAPHDIKAVDLATGITRQETAKNLGIDFVDVPNIGVDNGIHAARLMFSRLWVDETKCSLFLDAISQYRQEWNDKRGMFNEVPLHDWTSHAADQLRYAAVAEQDMSNDSTDKKIEEVLWRNTSRQDLNSTR